MKTGSMSINRLVDNAKATYADRFLICCILVQKVGILALNILGYQTPTEDELESSTHAYQQSAASNEVMMKEHHNICHNTLTNSEYNCRPCPPEDPHLCIIIPT